MPASIHEHPEEWLAAALADGLSPGERRALDEHLAGCERCRELQADFAALDETLLREFPLAVGPDGGFETRLVASFQRRQGRGWQWVKLRTLAGWLLRQRGVRFAGVAATLFGLIWLGQLLTDVTSRTEFASNDVLDSNDAGLANTIQIPLPKTTERQMPSVMPAKKDEVKVGSNDDLTGALEFRPETLRANLSPEIFLGSVPNGDIDVGRDVTAGFGKIQIPIIGPDASFLTRRGTSIDQARFTGGGQSFDGKDRSASDFTFALPRANTYTGATTITGGEILSPPSDAIGGGYAANNGFVTAPKTFRSDADFYRVVSGKKGEVIPNQRLAESGASTPSPAATPASGSTPAPSPASAANPPATDPAATPAPPDVRKLIRNARAELEVAGFDATVDAVTAAATRDGGFLDTRNSARSGNGKMRGMLVVKVLPEHLDRFLAALRTLGDLKNQTVQTEDVTKDYFDTDARLRNSRRMEERLLKMLDEVKGKMTEVLQVEKELARVRAEIETMQGQLKLYDAQVRYATVTLDVRERDLNQPAAFLLRQTATLSLLAADVERTAAEARRIADAAHAQTVRSEVTRDPSGKSRATVRLLIAPEASGEVLAQIKALGRVENFHVQDERVAQNGTSSDAAAQDPAKVERAPVTLDLTISHDEGISRQVTLTLVAGDVEGAFEKARAAAVAAGAEVVESNVTRASAGHANAALGVRVPASASAALLASFQSLGRAGEAETRRVGAGPEADAGPVLIRLSVVDAEPAVQQTVVRVQTTEVERRAGEIKREAAAGHATVEESNFASESDGRQRAGLRFRLPMNAYAEFVERVRALGAVKDFTVQRNDRPARTGEAAANAPVVVDLLLYSEGRIVGEESGLSNTLRRTFGQGAGALMWSVRMIGVAVAFLAPWAGLALLGFVVVTWWRRRSKNKRD